MLWTQEFGSQHGAKIIQLYMERDVLVNDTISLQTSNCAEREKEAVLNKYIRS